MSEEPRKISGWVNVYDDGSMTFFDTRKEAEGCWPEHRVACIYVSGTEGIEPEGDNA